MILTADISASQGIRFVNRTLYSSTLNTLETRLYQDVEFTNRDYVPYCTLVNKSDTAWFQLNTSFSDFEIYLVDRNWNKTALTYLPVGSYTTGGATNGLGILVGATTINIYNVDIDVSQLTGEYMVELRFNDGDLVTRFWSEKMDIQESHEDTLLIKWGGNSGIDDGFKWASVRYEIDRYQSIRVESRIIDYIPGAQKSTYEDSKSELTNLYSSPTMTHVLDFKEIPYYIHERISLALGHDEFYINDVLYNTDEEIELTHYKDQLLRTGSIQLRKVVYEENTPTEIVGEEIARPPYAIYAGEGVAIYAGAGKAIGFY